MVVCLFLFFLLLSWFVIISFSPLPLYSHILRGSYLFFHLVCVCVVEEGVAGVYMRSCIYVCVCICICVCRHFNFCAGHFNFN